MIIGVTRADVGTVARGWGRTYITCTTQEREPVRVWMGPESYQSLRDALREDHVVWCEVPEEQVVKSGTRSSPHAGLVGQGEGPGTAGAGWGDGDEGTVELAVHDENFLAGEKAAGFRDYDDYLAWAGSREGLLCTLLRAEGAITLHGDGGGGVRIAGAWDGPEGPFSVAGAFRQVTDAGVFESGVDFESAAWGAGDIATLVVPYMDYAELKIDHAWWSGTDPESPRDVAGLVLATATWELPRDGAAHPGGAPSGEVFLLRVGPRYAVYQCHGGETIRDDWDAPNDEAAVAKFVAGFSPPPGKDTSER